jgi:transglutaminase/protease-like cytokinesis protein 3
VTAINNTAILALDDLEELVISLESNANITRRSIITDLQAIQLAFQNIQGNLSGIIPAVQDEADIR